MNGLKPESMIRGHCPECGPERFAKTVGHHKTSYDHCGVWGQTDYRILLCAGCETPYFQTDYVFSEDIDHQWNDEASEWEQFLPHKIDHWPSPVKRQLPDWYWRIALHDRQLGLLFDDLYGALNAGLNVPAAIATRTLFDRASELLAVDPAIMFAKKLEKLHESGIIGERERDALETLTDAGSAAAHRGWKPDSSELGVLVTIAEAFLYRAFVLPDEAKKLAANIPKRPKPRSTKSTETAAH